MTETLNDKMFFEQVSFMFGFSLSYSKCNVEREEGTVDGIVHAARFNWVARKKSGANEKPCHHNLSSADPSPIYTFLCALPNHHIDVHCPYKLVETQTAKSRSKQLTMSSKHLKMRFKLGVFSSSTFPTRGRQSYSGPTCKRVHGFPLGRWTQVSVTSKK